MAKAKTVVGLDVHATRIVGNSSTALIESVIRSNAVRLSEFEHDSKRGLLILK